MNKLEYTILRNLMDKSWRVYKYIERWYGWRHIYLKYMHLRGENTQLHNAFLVKCAICYCILDAAKFQSGCKQSVRNYLSELVRLWRRQHAQKKYEWKMIIHNSSQFRFIFSPICLSMCRVSYQECQQRMLQMKPIGVNKSKCHPSSLSVGLSKKLKLMWLINFYHFN